MLNGGAVGILIAVLYYDRSLREVIKVKRNSDGKIFTSNMSERESIYEIHFCTSYTQVIVQEEDEEGNLKSKEIICEPIGTKPKTIDLIATQDNETGSFI